MKERKRRKERRERMTERERERVSERERERERERKREREGEREERSDRLKKKKERKKEIIGHAPTREKEWEFDRMTVAHHVLVRGWYGERTALLTNQRTSTNAQLLS